MPASSLARHLRLVVDPADVVALAVGDPDRLGQDPPLIGAQEPERHVNRRLAGLHGLYIRHRARLAQLVEHRSCKAEVAGSIPVAGLFSR